MFIKKRNNYSLYKPGNSRRLKIRNFIKWLIVFLIIFELITTLFFSTLKIKSESMNPSITENDYLIILPVFYSNQIVKYIKFPGIREPERGDIVLFTPSSVKKLPWYLSIPDSVYNFITFQKKSITDHSTYQNSSFIKRIIALPGDTVSIKNNVIYIKKPGSDLYKSEFELSNCEYNVTFSKQLENWESRQNPFSGLFEEKKLNANEYFLLGDNRDLTSDSRNTEPVRRNQIKGKIIFRYWPLKRIHAF